MRFVIVNVEWKSESHIYLLLAAIINQQDGKLNKTADNSSRVIDPSRLKVAADAAFDSYANKHDECLQGTRHEILSQIEKWADSPHGK
jgi:hypothetical protein